MVRLGFSSWMNSISYTRQIKRGSSNEAGQIAANAVRRQLRDLSRKICVTLQPIFVSKKLEQDLKPKDIKPSIVNRQCVVYKFACDLCDADYVGYTARHLHQRIAEHKYSSIGKHLLEAHGDKNLLNEGQFRVLKKCHGKFVFKNVFKSFKNVFKNRFLAIFYSEMF